VVDSISIGDTNVELWCSYIKDGGSTFFYIKMEARNKSSGEYLQIATFHPPVLNREATLTGEYLTGDVFEHVACLIYINVMYTSISVLGAIVAAIAL
jgi:hypothetical protein